MPSNSPFRHQRYGAKSDKDVQFLTAAPGPQAGSRAFVEQLQRCGQRLRAARVKAIYLIHGTFVGSDASGWIRRISRVIPKLGTQLHRLQKRALDSVLQDHSNYSEEFRSLLEKSLASDEASPPVRLFHWSSENHHIGRADGAIRLLHALTRETDIGKGERILIWAHSHGGNLMALLSQLLAATPAARNTFFDATRCYYQTRSGKNDLPVWDDMRRRCQQSSPLPATLDVVTFGTPVRYSWSRSPLDKLLHFIFHRPQQGVPSGRAKFPFTREEFHAAAGGDYIQQIGIAGTDFSPGLFSWRARKANRALRQLLEDRADRRHLYLNLLHGRRVHDAGRNLLVDYGPQEGTALSHLAGHALYTMTEWLHFHASNIVDRLYDDGKRERVDS